MIGLEQVSFGYGEKQETLSHVSATVARGECVLLCGASGCGKTTVTKLINGLIPAFTPGCRLEGRVMVNGLAPRETPMYELAQRVGSVFQNPKSQFFNLDTDSELAFGLENEGRPPEEIRRRVEQVAETLHLQELRGKNIFSLSGGQKQLLAFGSVYAMGPEIYVLDEPTANLDREAIARLHDQIAALKRQGCTIVVAEHRLYFLTDLIDRAFYLRSGGLERVFTGEQFRSLPDPEREALGLRTLTPAVCTLPAVESAGSEEGLSVKAFSQGERSYQKFAQAVASFRDFTMGWFRCTWASMNLCLSILPTTLLGTLPAGVALYQAGILDPAQVTLCLMLALGIVSPLMSATAFINSMKSMQFAVKDTRELLNLPQLTQAEQNVHLEGSGIQMRDVSFSYGGTEGKEVLRHLNLTIPQGKFTALVGPSGGGKSTIARLTARFWDVTGGSITLGGQDIRKLPLKQLSQSISFVTQDNFLFDCSLKENIRLGRPGASDEEVLAAAQAAQCEEFIGRLEHGWDTTAGDAGKQLSGGERQRIAIARAILKDAPIVILDEATAFTDPENEDKIQRSIMALSRGKTLLVIAHRLSTIQNADQIVVLEKGSVADCGTQEELLGRCPLYQTLWTAHVGARNWAVTSGKKEGN